MSVISTVTMPKWGMEMVEGEIAEWHVSEGDTIAAGDDLVDVETSKIVNTVSAPVGGVVRRLLASAGEVIAVGRVLAVIAPADTPAEEIEQYLAGQAAPVPSSAQKPADTAPEPAPAKVQDSPAAAAPPAPVAASLAGAEDDSGVAATPVARRVAREQGINLTRVSASGRHGRVTLADIEAALQAAGRQLAKPHSAARPDLGPPPRDDSAVAASPVARRLARELGVSLLDCRASGRHGRVSKADVEAASGRSSATPGARPAPDREVAARVEARPLSGMRRTIAARLQASKREAPHFRVQAEVEVDGLLAVREQLNRQYSEAKVSLNDLLVKACACALVAVPGVNVQFDGDTVQQFADADIAVAVALDEGLITPIVRGANRKGVLAISNEIRDLATRAKLGTLRPEEFQGGSFSVSNLGMYGIDQFDAIINSPQGAILAAGTAQQRPVVRQGELAVATVLTLSLSSDHRIIDGALAARFLSALRGFLENPATMLA
ncbi:MAG: 2-oxo acid dehydrogenase subunit E2 [Haliea sp.]|uniref:2-oxo acid dehydrogenase subunit E2 n=1 Tax=Haliea sp. TaxID=1932666 RepID=UPI0032EBD0FA